MECRDPGDPQVGLLSMEPVNMCSVLMAVPV